MFKCNFTAYEGDDKFIFISYAHKDSDMVYPIIERLNAEGYRVWYDDGITPGSEWPENIADHLDRCETFVFFASPNSVSSDNCKREVNFALSRKKKFFTISLVPTEFSLGLELQISTQQNILFYEYKDIVKFYDTLFLASSLADCKRTEVKAEPAPEVASEPDKIKKNEELIFDTEAKTVNSEPPQKKKSKKGLVIGLIIAAVVVLFVGIGILSAVGVTVGILSSKVKFDQYNVYEKDATYVSFSNDTIDSTYIKKLLKLKKTESISFNSCTFTDDADLSSLSALSNVDYIYIKNCNAVDYSFLEELPKLRSIHIEDGSFANIDSFKSSDINSVNLVNVKDVSLDIFASFTNLYSLELTDCTLIEEGIAPLPSGITNLILSGCNLSDSSFLSYSGFNNLYSLDLSNNNLTDVCFISGSYNSLYKLNLSGNPIDAPSLAVVQNCASISELDLSGIPLDDLSIVEQMRELEYLNLSGCGISDLSNGNFQTKTLEVLMLANNNITSLEPLKELQISEEGIEHLNVSHNPITSFDGLPEQTIYGNFIAYDTKITDKSSEALQYLSTCSFNTLVINYIEDIENLEINDNLYIIDCPGDINVSVPNDKYYSLDLYNTSASFDNLLREKMSQGSFYWF